MFYIYAFFNKLNSKIYIGKTKNLSARYKQHIYFSNKSNFAIHKAIKKYGKDNFEYIVLDYHENENIIYQLEEYYIKLFASNINGYNLNSGGLKPKHSKESKIKISNKRKGFKFKQESILKMKKTHKENPNYSSRRLTLDQAREIKLLYNSNNFNFDYICNKFNIKKQALYNLLNNKTYKELNIITKLKRTKIKKQRIKLEYKKCSMCFEIKCINDFYKNKSMLCERDSICKKCNYNFYNIRKNNLINNNKDKVLELWNSGLSSKLIAKNLNIKLNIVLAIIGDNSSFHKYNNINKFTKDFILSSDLSTKKLKELTGLKISYIRSIRKFKKKEYDFYDIFKLYQYGVKLKDICTLHKINKSSLRRILFE